MTFNSLRRLEVKGNLVADPEQRVSGSNGSGRTFTSLAIIETERLRDRDSGEWSDGQSRRWDITASGSLGENVVASLRKGDAVLVIGDGRIEQSERDGQVYQNFRILADEVCPTLTFQQVSGVERVKRGSGVAGAAHTPTPDQQYRHDQPYPNAVSAATAPAPASAGRGKQVLDDDF